MKLKRVKEATYNRLLLEPGINIASHTDRMQTIIVKEHYDAKGMVTAVKIVELYPPRVIYKIVEGIQ